MIHKPEWFRDDEVMVSTAPSCGLGKGGRLLPKVDRTTGLRVQEADPDTGELVDLIDDQLKADMIALAKGETTSTLRFVPSADVTMRTAVPTYYDRRFDDAYDEAMRGENFAEFKSMTIGDMIKDGMLLVRNGHGSPTQSLRVGTVPYIKVSDLRAGLVNINPTNRVPHAVAKKFWRGESSGLKAWDLICPERTSKNIGDFCMMLPGQEEVVATKEVIVLRPGPAATFDAYYLMWAMTLTIVRDQWRRVIFMQTNREDVGDRFYEIRVPVPSSHAHAERVAKVFNDYYTSLATARTALQTYFVEHPDHHFFIGAASEPGRLDVEDLEEDAAFAQDPEATESGES